jgi:hypothetical protein
VVATPTPIDLTQMGPDEILTAFGHFVTQSLQRAGAAVFIQRPDGSVTVLNPRILLSVPDEEMAQALLACWSEADVETYFASKYEQASGE